MIQLDITSTVTVTVYATPNPFSLAYWLIPLIFIGTFTMYFFITAMIFDRESGLFMALLGLVSGSWVALLAGIIPLPLIIMELVIFFVYLWRSD